MILAIDIGNTNIVIGIYENNIWTKIWRIQTDRWKTADEYEVIVRSLFRSSKISLSDIRKIVLSSVVPSMIRTFNEMLKQIIDIKVILVEPSIYNKLPIKIINPNEIGADLVADATAAFHKYTKPVMVIDFGTAITFTTIGRTGQILGVVIAPGLQTALKSLTGNTAQLPEVQLKAPPSVLGKNTVNAIQSGMVFGFAGLVDSIVSRTENEIGEKLNVVGTGGLSAVLTDVSEKIGIIDENLTIDGLRIIAEIVKD